VVHCFNWHLHYIVDYDCDYCGCLLDEPVQRIKQADDISFSIAATTEVLREAKYKSETSSVDDHRGSIFQFRSRGAKITFADEIDGTNNRTSQ